MKKLLVILACIFTTTAFTYHAQPYFTYGIKLEQFSSQSLGVGCRKRSEEFAVDASLEINTDFLRNIMLGKLYGVFYFPTDQKIAVYMLAGVEVRRERYNDYFFTSDAAYYFFSPTFGMGIEKSKCKTFSKFFDVSYINYNRSINHIYHNRNKAFTMRFGFKI